jgi:hypothetical protein
MDLRKIVWEGVDWIYLIQNRDQWWAVQSMVMNLRFLVRDLVMFTDYRE